MILFFLYGMRWDEMRRKSSTYIFRIENRVGYQRSISKDVTRLLRLEEKEKKKIPSLDFNQVESPYFAKWEIVQLSNTIIHHAESIWNTNSITITTTKELYTRFYMLNWSLIPRTRRNGWYANEKINRGRRKRKWCDAYKARSNIFKKKIAVFSPRTIDLNGEKKNTIEAHLLNNKNKKFIVLYLKTMLDRDFSSVQKTALFSIFW